MDTDLEVKGPRNGSLYFFSRCDSAKILAATHDPARAENGMPHTSLLTNRQRRLAIDVRFSELSSQITGAVRSFAASIFCAETLRVRRSIARGSNRNYGKEYDLGPPRPTIHSMPPAQPKATMPPSGMQL